MASLGLATHNKFMSKSTKHSLPPLSGWRLAVKNALSPANPRGDYTASSLSAAIGRGRDYVADIWREHPRHPGSYRKNSFKATEAAAIEQLLHLPRGICGRDDDGQQLPQLKALPASARRSPDPRMLIEESLKLGVLLAHLNWTPERFASAAQGIEEFLLKNPFPHEAPEILQMRIELQLRRIFEK
jgi:hypothetical protein